MKKVLFGFAFAVALPLFAQQKPVYLDASKPMEVRVEDALKRLTVEEKVAMLHAQSKFSSPGVPRLGIPEFWMTDGPHGIRPEVLWDEWNQAGWTNDSCVAFPALTCLAATWNPEMSMLYGKSIGEEARYRNKTVLLGPGVNIYRTPLNGRNFEYMGEDPYLASRMVVPYVQGVQQNGVAACVKHYALNNQEINRHTTNVIVDDRALYEIYLPAFKAAVQEGKAWSIMGAYNLYKGQHPCPKAFCRTLYKCVPPKCISGAAAAHAEPLQYPLPRQTPEQKQTLRPAGSAEDPRQTAPPDHRLSGSHRFLNLPGRQKDLPECPGSPSP